MSRPIVLTAILLASLQLAACTRPQPLQLTKTPDLPESDKKPVITAILDYGNYELPTDGRIAEIKGDGMYVPGEVVIIRGQNFGRLPTVTIAEKATPVLARLGDGAIITRMPHDIDGGRQKVAVSNEKGLHQKEITVLRYALAQAPGAKDVILFNGWSFAKVATYTVGTVRGVLFSRDTSYAYILTSSTSGFTLLTMDLTTSPKPKFQDKKKFSGSKLLGFGYSASRKVLVAITDQGVQGFSLESPGSPIASVLQPWPKGFASNTVVEAALSPDGKVVATLLTTDNSLAFFDVQVLHNMKTGPRLQLLPEAKVPLLRSLKFHEEKSGATLYVLTGDTPASLKVGYHDNRVVLVEVRSAPDRTQEIKAKVEATRPLLIDKVTPSTLTFSRRGANKLEDTAITKWTRYFYYTMFHAELLTLAKNPLSTPSGLQAGIELLAGLPFLGVLHRLDDKSSPRTFRKIPKVTGALSISTDGRQALAVNCIPRTDKAKLSVAIPCEIEVVDLDTGRSQAHPSGKLTPAAFVPPFRFGTTAIQD